MNTSSIHAVVHCERRINGDLSSATPVPLDAEEPSQLTDSIPKRL